MRRFVDLHTHSTASDGVIAPAKLIDLADQAELAMIALTDHDSIAGLAAAADRAMRYPDLAFVPGIEISAAWPVGTMHILGLGLDPENDELHALTDRLRAAREQRNPRMVEKLQALGLEITMDDVLESVRGSTDSSDRIVSRMHMADAIRRKGYVKTNKDAFDRYVGHGAAAFIDKERTPPSQAIGSIHAAGGVAVLAHPTLLNCTNRAQLERVIRDLKHVGLDGVECYHSDLDVEATRLCLDLARKHGLVVTGGSDFHGAPKPTVVLGHPRVSRSALGEEFLSRLTA